MRHIDILDVSIACLDRASALHEIERLHGLDPPARVYYANAHTLNLASRDASYKQVLQRADLVLNDGAGVALAARLQGRRFVENLNGSDFNPLIVELAARRGWPVYFLGADQGVAATAAHRLKARYPSLQVAGTHHGYVSNIPEVVGEIRATRTDLLMVAMGNPLQERFLDRHLGATGARLGVGVGAFFDFTAGKVSRSPSWMNKAGIEWVYRLGQEPKRMWKRYVVGNPAFIARAVKDRIRQKR